LLALVAAHDDVEGVRVARVAVVRRLVVEDTGTAAEAMRLDPRRISRVPVVVVVDSPASALPNIAMPKRASVSSSPPSADAGTEIPISRFCGTVNSEPVAMRSPSVP
jgi:hypothetical protein